MQANVINAFADLLPAVLWTQTDSLFATGRIDYPLGLAPTVDGGTVTPKSVAGCRPYPFATIGPVVFTPYDPGREQPPPFPTCVMFPMDTTSIGTLNNLATAISDNTPFNAVASSGPLRVTITAKLAGPNYNWYACIGDGAYGVGTGFITGGGYEFTSKAEAAASVGGVVGNVAQYKVQILSADRGEGIIIYFDFTANTGTASYGLSSAGSPGPDIDYYAIVANPYSFGIRDQTEDNYFPWSLRRTSLYAAAPLIPVDGWTTAYAMFIVWHSLPVATYWNGQNGGAFSCALNGPLATGVGASGGNGWPRVLSFHSPGSPLITPDGKPLVTGAYVMFSSLPADTPAVIGRLVDCAVLGTYVDLGGVSINDHNCAVLSRQISVYNSLVMAWE